VPTVPGMHGLTLPNVK